MVSEDTHINELILQVFEEHEDVFFWPVLSQKDAKTFVKFIHEKGAPYEDIGKEIGEFEHNFSAWRKGLGRVGIGTRMIERINKTVESVIDSDDEDNLDFNLKQLSKVNKKNEAKSHKSKTATEKSQPVSTQVKASTQQQNDLTNAMSKNIDKHIEQKQVPKQEAVKRSEPLTNGSASKKETVQKQEPVPTKREPPKQEPVVKKEEKIFEEKVEKNVTTSVKKISMEKEPEKADSTQEKTDKKSTEKQENNNEVDEVKKKMEALKKKVEMMKKQKAEKQAASHPPANQTDGQGSSASVQSPSAGADSGDKYVAMRKRIEELRNKIKPDDDEPVKPQEADEQVPPKPKDIPLSPKVESAPFTPLIAPMAAEEAEVRTESDEDEEETAEADEIYDSDIDPDNYDSDLEYDFYKDVQKLANLVQNEKSRQRARDGPGHVYMFSDSPADERKHRIKVGATRSPDKKFRQAQSFNPSFKMVSCTAVSKRKAALKDVHQVLQNYKLDGYDDWFTGPIDKILQNVSTVTEKFGSGPALTSFETDTRC